MKQGFTLIELLVVVLIIGILAAVALPQYQRAVEKSRAAQALTLLKSVGNAFEAHHLANGGWATSFDELAVDIPWTGNTAFIPQRDVQDTRSNSDWSLQLQHWQGYVAIIVGRISGKYQGSGFGMQFQTPDGTASKDLVCIERISASNFLFDTSLPDGAFCNKIMQGSFRAQNTWNRSYDLPY